MMSNLHVKILCFLLLISAGHSAFSQKPKDGTLVFSGTISDQNKRPVIGASLEIQESSTITFSDKDGKFSIRALSKDVLIIKKTNFVTSQVVLDALANLNIQLTASLTDAGEEDEVIIPFGMRKRREINSAMSSFRTSDLPQLLVSNLNNALQGRLSGLYIQQTDNRPGNDNANIYVRGRSSYGSAGARILIDGVPRDFQDMDVNEIENITVLKDAAAQAFYGLRAGQGVVLVTTRRGSALRSSINVDVQGGVQVAQNIIQPISSYDYVTLYNEAKINDQAGQFYHDTIVDAIRNGTKPFQFPNNNYIDRFLNKSSNIQRYVLSAEGGNSSLRYFVLLSYLNQGGLFANTKSDDYNSNTGFKRFNFRGNIDFDVNKNLTISLYSGGRAENRLDPGDNTGTVLSALYNTPPMAFPILNQNGTYGGTTEFRNNPLGMLTDRGYISAVDRVLLASLSVKQKLDFWLPGLSANAYYSYDVSGTYTNGLNRDYEIYDVTGATPVLYRSKTPLGYRSAAFTNNNRRNEFWAGFDYDHSFGNHRVNATIKAQRNVNASPERLDFRGQGAAARVDYSFRDKYYLGFVGSYSGSENFPPRSRYGFFPALSAGYVVLDKGYTEQSVLSYLKVRASAGNAGNSEIGGNRFPFESFYARNVSGGGYVFGTGFSATPSANESNLGNPFITWETFKSINLGLELKLFRNSFSLSADVYKGRRTGILTDPALPSVLGQSLGTVNDGIVDSKGMEFSTNYNKQVGKLGISFYGNILLSTDKVIAQNGQVGLPEYQTAVGKVAGSFLVYVPDGFFVDKAQIDASPNQSTLAGKTYPGDVKYKDVGSITGQPDGKIDGFDRIRINKRDLPNTYYGFGSTLTYQAFDLSINFNGVAGRTIDVQGIVNSGPANFNQETFKRWTPQTAATAIYPRIGIADRGNNTAASSIWQRSGDYTRLKYVEVGASISQKFVNKYHIKKARFYIGGFNLLAFDKLDLDIDPEIPGAGRGSAYPYLKTFSCGLRVTF